MDIYNDEFFLFGTNSLTAKSMRKGYLLSMCGVNDVSEDGHL
jgi:hypothetical protein